MKYKLLIQIRVDIVREYFLTLSTISARIKLRLYFILRLKNFLLEINIIIDL